jgi:tetratricopeptide (TPR) repeat protein
MTDVISNPPPLIAQNQEEFAELLTFLDFAEGLTIGFVEVNQAADQSVLVEALRAAVVDKGIHIEVFNFSQEPELRFLREALLERLERVRTDQKLVLWVQGLEVAIGTDAVGAYPPLLQDLNFVRDAYRQSVPYPTLIVLPDYSITRVSQYAPDFWAWRSGVFCFKTSAHHLQQLRTTALNQSLPPLANPDNQAQIDHLKQLLMELKPSGQPMAPQAQQTCIEVYYKLGSAHLTQRQAAKARDYLLKGLELAQQDADSLLLQNFQRKLGHAYEQLRQFEKAIAAYEQALELARSSEQLNQEAMILNDLGDVTLKQRQFSPAQALYQQSLAINESLGDRYSQASTYSNLGIVAQELREWALARKHYNQALEIFIEYGDRYEQASTYYQLAMVAEATGDLENAKLDYLKDLEITLEFKDEHGLDISLANLARFYQAHPDDVFLAQMAQLMNVEPANFKRQLLSGNPKP